MAAEPARIALIKLSSLGDVVHALPVAATLRAAFPAARLTWIVERRESTLLRAHPALDQVITVELRRWRKARTPSAALEAAGALVELHRRLRAGGFDTAIDLGGLLKTGALTRATGAPLRIGFARRHCREPLSVLFTNRHVTPPVDARHVVDQYLALLAPLGVREPRLEFPLPLDPAAEARADAAFEAWDLKPRQRIVVLNPGAARAAKRWPVARFAELAARLTRDAAAGVVVVWGPGEESEARAIVQAAGAASGAQVRLAPPTDLDGLVAVLRRASVVVAGDTGPLHLAAALGRPCVGLYGPTAAARNGPYGAGHRALQSPAGTMTGLATGAVFDAVAQVLA